MDNSVPFQYDLGTAQFLYTYVWESPHGTRSHLAAKCPSQGGTITVRYLLMFYRISSSFESVNCNKL